MSTYLDTFESARNYGIGMAGVDPKTVTLIEDDALRVQSAAGFLSDPNTPEGQEMIRKDLEGQRGFRFKNKNDVDVTIVVAPFRDGFCVWGILPSGAAMRF